MQNVGCDMTSAGFMLPRACLAANCEVPTSQVIKQARSQAHGGFLPASEFNTLPSVGEKHGPDGANADKKASFEGDTKCSNGACDCMAQHGGASALLASCN